MFDPNVWLRRAPELHAYVYFGFLIAIALIEAIVPRRAVAAAPGRRWLVNFAVTAFNTVLIRLLVPVAGAALAAACADRGLGLLNNLAVPGWLAIVVSILALDLTNYAAHYVLHRVPVLWRIHRMHHTDQDYDFSIAVRFHPFESIYATAFIGGAIALLGAPPVAVLVWQLLGVAINFIEHANVRVPADLDAIVRLVFVTPDMHRIHHSRERRESQSNYANVFSWWDRLFGTYIARPAAGHDDIRFGVAGFLDEKHSRLPWMLAGPFLSKDRAERPHPPLGVATDAGSR